MRIPSLFSKTKTATPKKLVVDELPPKFRMQVVHIWKRALGSEDHDQLVIKWWGFIHDVIAEAHGHAWLHPSVGHNQGYFGAGSEKVSACRSFFIEHASTDEALDMIQMSFRLIERLVPDSDPHLRQFAGITANAEQAVEDLNAYFAESGLAYRYKDGEILRIDSELLHAEVTEKAPILLHVAGFTGPEQEFRVAHDHYRKGRLKEATTEALKAFESTMKAIATSRGWTFKPVATAKELIALMFEKKVLPPFMETEFAGLRQLLESGVPTIRNKKSGHGQGAVPVDMPPHLAALALHIAAANIVFLAEAHAAMK